VIRDGLSPLADAGATGALDALLTDYEKHPLARTPLENLDLIGSFYVPKEGPEECLIVVAMNCTLGWYDALRFGSESGRAEIVDNEHFFNRAFVLSGDGPRQKMAELVKDHPDRVKTLVETGLRYAEKFRNTDSYDRHWPTVYGMGPVIAALGGHPDPPTAVPASGWDKAWEDAKDRVRAYYRVN
jgi:hypothetical protein